MRIHDNAIAGQSVERLAALSDGLFAVAMTILVLDLKVPAREASHGEGALLGALTSLAPRLLIYLMSFLTLGIFLAAPRRIVLAVTRRVPGSYARASNTMLNGDAAASLMLPKPPAEMACRSFA